MSFATDAPRYFEAGINVIPIIPRAKVPPEGMAWKPWQTHRQTEQDLGAMIDAHPTAGTGIILGGPGAIIDIETDGPAGEWALRDLRLPLPGTAMFESTRGVHRLYGGENVPSRKGLRPQLDVLGSGYVVAPASAVGFG